MAIVVNQVVEHLSNRLSQASTTPLVPCCPHSSLAQQLSKKTTRTQQPIKIQRGRGEGRGGGSAIDQGADIYRPHPYTQSLDTNCNCKKR